MKSMITIPFTAIIIIMIMQPMIEIYSLMTHKVELGAAILNSCRAARNNAVMDYYFEGGGNAADLEAYIDDVKIMEFFADAFSKTLGVDNPQIDLSGNTVRFDGNQRWNWIKVVIEWDDEEDGNHLDGRIISRATVELKTPYMFKTGLLKRLIGQDGDNHGYHITELRLFDVQIVN